MSLNKFINWTISTQNNKLYASADFKIKNSSSITSLKNKNLLFCAAIYFLYQYHINNNLTFL